MVALGMISDNVPMSKTMFIILIHSKRHTLVTLHSLMIGGVATLSRDPDLWTRRM